MKQLGNFVYQISCGVYWRSSSERFVKWSLVTLKKKKKKKKTEREMRNKYGQHKRPGYIYIYILSWAEHEIFSANKS